MAQTIREMRKTKIHLDAVSRLSEENAEKNNTDHILQEAVAEFNTMRDDSSYLCKVCSENSRLRTEVQALKEAKTQLINENGSLRQRIMDQMAATRALDKRTRVNNGVFIRSLEMFQQQLRRLAASNKQQRERSRTGSMNMGMGVGVGMTGGAGHSETSSSFASLNNSIAAHSAASVAACAANAAASATAGTGAGAGGGLDQQQPLFASALEDITAALERFADKLQGSEVARNADMPVSVPVPVPVAEPVKVSGAGEGDKTAAGRGSCSEYDEDFDDDEYGDETFDDAPESPVKSAGKPAATPAPAPAPSKFAAPPMPAPWPADFNISSFLREAGELRKYALYARKELRAMQGKQSMEREDFVLKMRLQGEAAKDALTAQKNDMQREFEGEIRLRDAEIDTLNERVNMLSDRNEMLSGMVREALAHLPPGSCTVADLATAVENAVGLRRGKGLASARGSGRNSAHVSADNSITGSRHFLQPLEKSKSADLNIPDPVSWRNSLREQQQHHEEHHHPGSNVKAKPPSQEHSHGATHEKEQEQVQEQQREATMSGNLTRSLRPRPKSAGASPSGLRQSRATAPLGVGSSPSRAGVTHQKHQSSGSKLLIDNVAGVAAASIEGGLGEPRALDLVGGGSVSNVSDTDVGGGDTRKSMQACREAVDLDVVGEDSVATEEHRNDDDVMESIGRLLGCNGSGHRSGSGSGAEALATKGVRSSGGNNSFGNNNNNGNASGNSGKSTTTPAAQPRVVITEANRSTYIPCNNNPNKAISGATGHRYGSPTAGRYASESFLSDDNAPKESTGSPGKRRVSPKTSPNGSPARNRPSSAKSSVSGSVSSAPGTSSQQGPTAPPVFAPPPRANSPPTVAESKSTLASSASAGSMPTRRNLCKKSQNRSNFASNASDAVVLKLMSTPSATLHLSSTGDGTVRGSREAVAELVAADVAQQQRDQRYRADGKVNREFIGAGSASGSTLSG